MPRPRRRCKMDDVVKRVAVAVLLFALLGVAACRVDLEPAADPPMPMEIKSSLDDLPPTAAHTRKSVAHELAWMLQRGTLLERRWANDALAVLPPAVRDWVKDAHEDEPDAPSAAARNAGESTAKAPSRVRVTLVLVRTGKDLLQWIGVYPPHGKYRGDPKSPDFPLVADALWAEALELGIEKSPLVLTRWSSKTVQTMGAHVQLSIDERVVLHVTTSISQDRRDRRYISIEGRAHAKDSGVLLFAPRFNARIPDGGGLWIWVRDVIDGKPSPDRELGILLRMEVVSVDGEAGR